VRSQTGSGKSAAFLLPLIELIYREKINKKFESTKNPYAVIFLPTRELCIQLANEAIRLCENTEVKVLFSFGGIPMVKTREMAKKGADIVIGTPARIYDLFFDEIYDPIFNLNNLKYVVLDEYDKLISGNMIKQILDFKENLVSQSFSSLFISYSLA
jgi:superfamily II DNA/RNA helicase